MLPFDRKQSGESDQDEENKMLDFQQLYLINQYESIGGFHYKYGEGAQELDGASGRSAEESSEKPKLEERIRRPPAIIPSGKRQSDFELRSASKGKKDPKTPLTTLIQFSPKLFKQAIKRTHDGSPEDNSCRGHNFRARPYVMRRIKEALKQLFQIEKTGVLKEKGFTKNINEKFYRDLFTSYNEFINKQLLFEKVRQEIKSGAHCLMEIKQLRKVERTYTFTNKEIQKVMWAVLGKPTKKQSYNSQEYRSIFSNLQQTHSLPAQLFWQQVVEKLKKNSEAKFDQSQIQRIQSQFFSSR